MSCPDYDDPYASDPPTCTGWMDEDAPYAQMPTDTYGLFCVTPAYDDTDPGALPDTDCDYLIDMDDDTADDDDPQSDLELSLRIHLRNIRIRVRTEDPCFWRHVRALYHQRASSEATQELLHWEATHPKSGGS